MRLRPCWAGSIKAVNEKALLFGKEVFIVQDPYFSPTLCTLSTILQGEDQMKKSLDVISIVICTLMLL